MKKLVIFVITLLLLTITGCGIKQDVAVENSRETKTITDLAGRNVVVPAKINTVYSVGPTGTIFMYSLAPDKIIGRNWETTAGEKKYTLASYQQLPVLGGTFGQGNVMNKEVILKAKPDIILYMAEKVTKDAADKADELQSELNIPVVVVGLELKKMDEAYLFMGRLLGAEEQAEKLASYCKGLIEDVTVRAAAIPPDKQIRVYYAEGDEGLETDPAGSGHTEVLDLVRGINVAEVETKTGYGRARVSMEQIFKWNPETLIVCYDPGYQEKNPYSYITSNDMWNKVQAVQGKKVYQIPSAPFNWFDRPPGINQLIGVKWLANLLYPDYFKYDIRQETKEFYKLFYHVELTEQDVDELIKVSR